MKVKLTLKTKDGETKKVLVSEDELLRVDDNYTIVSATYVDDEGNDLPFQLPFPKEYDA